MQTRLNVFIVGMAVGLPTSAFAYSTTPDINTTGYTPSASDLLQTSLSSTVAPVATGNFQREGVPGETALRDGSFGKPGDAAHGTGQATAGTGESVLYTLDTSGNPLGYDITEVDTYAGWSYGRYGQGYTVSFHAVGTPAGTYAAPFSVSYDPEVTGDANYTSNNYNTQVKTTDPTLGTLATGVDQVLFTFADTSTSVVTGYNGYRELDVFGAATLPEPGSLSVLGIGVIGTLTSRRRRRV